MEFLKWTKVTYKLGKKMRSGGIEKILYAGLLLLACIPYPIWYLM